ncbi:MAG: ATP-binding protein [Deltaproteobacteria bacterium]|nr:ATP-binding protein [Deltaproteobacteria bacterium]
MLDEYIRHNLFLDGLERFTMEDPQLALLQDISYVHPLDWWMAIDWAKPGIIILTGGRQIGKSTSLKLCIKHVLQDRAFSPSTIFYLPCDQIIDATHLNRVLRLFLDAMIMPTPRFLLIIDEVTFVTDWDRVIKALADEGWFRHGFCILTGSDSVILQEATVRFPGRRGNAARVDFHLLPLSFREYVALIQPHILSAPSEQTETLFALFQQYLQCGGYLRAINELHQHGEIGAATHMTFEQWIRGDCLKRGKSEPHLLSLLHALLAVGVSQVTYSGLTERVGSMSKETLLDYCRLLERMDVLFTLQAFDQNTRQGFPKKARKFHFCDPFIRTTVARWLAREGLASTPIDEATLVEATVAAQFHRRLPCYYIKAAGEVDLVLVVGKTFLPIEVKWSRTLRPNDFAQLRKYSPAVILSKQPAVGTIEDTPSIPLPLFLLEHHSAEAVRRHASARSGHP